MLDGAGETITTLVRLSGLKCPIIPPRCQQAAVPQWKTANFEQYPYFLLLLLLLNLSSDDTTSFSPTLQPQHSHLSLQKKDQTAQRTMLHTRLGLLAQWQNT